MTEEAMEKQDNVFMTQEMQTPNPEDTKRLSQLRALRQKMMIDMYNAQAFNINQRRYQRLIQEGRGF